MIVAHNGVCDRDSFFSQGSQWRRKQHEAGGRGGGAAIYGGHFIILSLVKIASKNRLRRNERGFFRR